MLYPLLRQLKFSAMSYLLSDFNEMYYDIGRNSEGQIISLVIHYLPEGCSLDFSEFKFLKVLTISGLITTGSELGDEGASNLILPEGLEKLDLSGNNIGDEGAKRLTYHPD